MNHMIISAELDLSQALGCLTSIIKYLEVTFFSNIWLHFNEPIILILVQVEGDEDCYEIAYQ